MSARARGPWWAHCLIAGVWLSIAIQGTDDVWLVRGAFALLFLHSVVLAAEAYRDKAIREWIMYAVKTGDTDALMEHLFGSKSP